MEEQNKSTLKDDLKGEPKGVSREHATRSLWYLAYRLWIGSRVFCIDLVLPGYLPT